jgi:hypothetical protein
VAPLADRAAATAKKLKRARVSAGIVAPTLGVLIRLWAGEEWSRDKKRKDETSSDQIGSAPISAQFKRGDQGQNFSSPYCSPASAHNDPPSAIVTEYPPLTSVGLTVNFPEISRPRTLSFRPEPSATVWPGQNGRGKRLFASL